MEKNDSNYLNSVRKLYSASYYWGPLSYVHTEKLLKNRENGSFLVRDSTNDRFLFTITFKSNDYIYHIRMQHVSNGLFKFQNSNETIEPQDAKTLIDTVVENSKTGYSYFLNRENMESLSIKFLYPVSRFKERPVCSLQHLARFEILKHVRRDNIDKLHLPNKLKIYLKKSQIFIELNPSIDC